MTCILIVSTDKVHSVHRHYSRKLGRNDWGGGGGLQIFERSELCENMCNVTIQIRL